MQFSVGGAKPLFMTHSIETQGHGERSRTMKNKNLIRFVESFIILPIATVSLPFGNFPINNSDIVFAPQIVLLQKENIEANAILAFNQVKEEEAEILNAKAEAIDEYFRVRNMPLSGLGKKMVIEAEKNNLDWRLLPAISVIESTGGKNQCKKMKNNPFGWGSCKIGFISIEESIETIARNLGGNNPNTAYHYANKNTEGILKAYNPPSIVPDYSNKVFKVMNIIGLKELTIDPTFLEQG